MTTELSRRHLIALAAASAASPALLRAQTSSTPLKVGILYNTPIADVGWNFQHHGGILEMEKAFPGKVKVQFVENVAEGPDAERVIRQLVKTSTSSSLPQALATWNPRCVWPASSPR